MTSKYRRGFYKHKIQRTRKYKQVLPYSRFFFFFFFVFVSSTHINCATLQRWCSGQSVHWSLTHWHPYNKPNKVEQMLGNWCLFTFQDSPICIDEWASAFWWSEVLILTAPFTLPVFFFHDTDRLQFFFIGHLTSLVIKGMRISFSDYIQVAASLSFCQFIHKQPSI